MHVPCHFLFHTSVRFVMGFADGQYFRFSGLRHVLYLHLTYVAPDLGAKDHKAEHVMKC